MADVFFSFRPTVRRGTIYPMELAKNKEIPGWMLQRRVRIGTSRTYYLHETAHGEQEYPYVDGTGYLLVWLRKAGAYPPKRGVLPDERWYLTERGAVVRVPWDLSDAAVTGSDVDVVLTHARVRPADREVCKGCDQLPALTGACGCS